MATRTWRLSFHNGTEAAIVVAGFGAPVTVKDQQLKLLGEVEPGQHSFQVKNEQGVVLAESSVLVDQDLLLSHFGAGRGRRVRLPYGSERLASVVVVIPGIPGSTLEKGGRMVWPPASASQIGDPLAPLLLNEAGEDADGVTAEPAKPIKEMPGTDLYGTMFSGLKAAGYTEYAKADQIPSGARAAIGFPYDWRKDLRRSAGLLKRTIDTALARSGCEDVVLIGHSMGALLATTFMALHPTVPVRSAMLLGPPLHGASAAFVVLKLRSLTGVESALSPLLSLIGHLPAFLGLGFGGNKLLEMLQNCPGIYQLLPSEWADEVVRRTPARTRGFVNLHGIQIHSPAAYSLLRGAGFRHDLARAGLKLHADIRAAVYGMFGDSDSGPIGYQKVFLFGSDQPTTNRLEIKLGHFHIFTNDDQYYVAPDGPLKKDHQPRVVLRPAAQRGDPLFELRPLRQDPYFSLLMPGEPRFALRRTRRSSGLGDGGKPWFEVTATPWYDDVDEQQWRITPEGYLENKLGGVLTRGAAGRGEPPPLLVEPFLPHGEQRLFRFEGADPQWSATTDSGDGTVPQWSLEDFYGHGTLGVDHRQTGVGLITCPGVGHRGMAADLQVVRQVITMLHYQAQVLD